MTAEIPNGYYRVSIKALILDETRTKFLLTQEESGTWEFPGGGLDWGESPQEGIKREIQEEMGIQVTSVSNAPSYFLTEKRDIDGKWAAFIFYVTTIPDLNFTPTSECVAAKFTSPEEANALDVFKTVRNFAEVFDPAKHKL